MIMADIIAGSKRQPECQASDQAQHLESTHVRKHTHPYICIDVCTFTNQWNAFYVCRTY